MSTNQRNPRTPNSKKKIMGVTIISFVYFLVLHVSDHVILEFMIYIGGKNKFSNAKKKNESKTEAKF